MRKNREQPQSITWKQFKRGKYCAFASLKRQICIGVLSVATLGVAAQAAAEMTDSCAVKHPTSVEEEDQEMEEVTVSGAMAPLTQLQAARIATVITRSEIERAGAQSVNDLLKLASGVDVRQRGGFGIQTDISIDGGIFDQITLLLNGVNINNPQTGHLSADFPVTVSDIECIEVLEGAASRVYGGQSFGGAINIVTKRREKSVITTRAEGGMNASFQAEARVELVTGKLGNRLSGGGGRSDGGTANSQWKKGQIYYQGDWQNEQVALNWQFGFNKKDYGANTFYSAAYPDQYERNERYLLSVGAETKGRFSFTPLLYWQRNYDNFELTHGSPVGENFHMSQAYGLKLGGNLRWWGGRTAVAAEVRQENILSTNLGTDLDSTKFIPVTGESNAFYTRSDHRTILSYSLEHNILLHRWTISVGVMASMATSTDHRHRFYPGADIAYRPATGWKLYVNYNKGFRLPSFTELYYKSPTHEGNKTLQPEENHSLQVGAQYQCQGVQATLRGFYHIGNNIIDWVMYHPEDNYHSTSFTLDNMGVQATCKLDFTTLMKRDTWVKDITLGYTFIHQTRHDDTPIYRSNYALEYLRHKLVATLHHRIWSHLTAHWSFRWQDRMGGYLSNGTMVPYSSHPNLDVKVQWMTEKYSVYVQGTNLTNQRYYDLGNVPQPGIWVMAGASVNIKL